MAKAGLSKQTAVILLIIANDETRQGLMDLLNRNNYVPRVLSDPSDVSAILKDQKSATAFVDCEAVAVFGTALYSKIKVASPLCRVILFCDKNHEQHQQILREAMELGAYACLLAPYKDWEVLTMVRHSLAPRPVRKRTSGRGGAARQSG